MMKMQENVMMILVVLESKYNNAKVFKNIKKCLIPKGDLDVKLGNASCSKGGEFPCRWIKNCGPTAS